MDSGNSGCVQSSSGGDEEEYDSQPFFNHSAPFASISNPTTLPNHQTHPQPSTTFVPQPHHFDTFSQSTAPNPNLNPNNLYNLDLVWSRGLRSDPNYTNFGNSISPLPSSSAASASSSSQSLLADHHQSLGQVQLPNNPNPMPLRSVADGNDATMSRPSPPSGQTNQAKNSKKRTRASRRAPTTVLTTDTTNFRQMVQEFTGIPAAPFSGSAYSRWLDLFGTSSRPGHLDPLGSLYPLRPSAQKAQLSPLLLSSSSPSLYSTSMMDAIARTATTTSNPNNNNTNTLIGSASSNYQLPSHDIGLLSPKQPPQAQTLFAMQNPILGYQSFLQSPVGQPPKHPLLANNAPISSVSSLDQLGSTSGTQPSSRNANGNNCSVATTSELQLEKTLENVSSRPGEGTVDSWICPSD